MIIKLHNTNTDEKYLFTSLENFCHWFNEFGEGNISDMVIEVKNER